MSGERWMESRYPGACACGRKFKRGALIRWSDALRNKGLRGSLCITACARCEPTEAAKGPSDRYTGAGTLYAPDPVDRAYEDQCAAACGLDSLTERNS